MFSLLHLYLLLSQMLHVINAYEPGYQSVPNILEKFLNFSFLLTVSVWKLKSNLVKFSNINTFFFFQNQYTKKECLGFAIFNSNEVTKRL